MQGMQDLASTEREFANELYPLARQLERTAHAVFQCGECEAVYNGTSFCDTLWPCLFADGLGSEFQRNTVQVPEEVAHSLDVLRLSTGWHAWGVSFPLYSLLLVCSAIAAGAVFGRRNLLISAQFASVIILVIAVSYHRVYRQLMGAISLAGDHLVDDVRRRLARVCHGRRPRRRLRRAEHDRDQRDAPGRDG